MTRIFVYEASSGNGGAPASRRIDAELREAGVAMRDAIVGDLLRLPGLSVTCAIDDLPGGDAPPRGAALATARPRDGEAPPAFVARLAQAHDACWIVAPETDGLLGRLQAAVGADRWIGCDAQAIRVASSKRATLAALASRGVRTPLALAGAASHRGRWIVKPDDGAGCLATRVHRDLAAAQADVDDRRRRGASATLEPFVEGEALSISMLVGANLARVIAMNRQRIEIDAEGVLHDLGVEPAAIDARTDARAADLDALATATARALPGLRGFVGIDVVWNRERGAVPIEVNPRVTCAYVGLSRKLGRNVAAEVLRLHAVESAA